MADSVVRPRTATAREAAVAVPAPRGRARQGRLTALWYVLPALLFYAVFVIIPWLHSLWISFWEWNGIGVATWVGLANYVEVGTDPELRSALLHAFGLVLFYTIMPISLGLILAALVAGAPWKAMGFLRTVLFLPQILPLVAVGVVWKWIFAGDGPFNGLLSKLGLGGATTAWLGDFTYAFPAVGLVGTWVSTGLCFLLLLAGIGKIEPSLYEAARLDGSGPIREFWHVTVPGLRREIVVAATLTVITALTSFDLVYVMTSGGPGDATMVPGVAIYKLTFTAGRVGTACALATILSLLTGAVMYGLNRLGQEKT